MERKISPFCKGLILFVTISLACCSFVGYLIYRSNTFISPSQDTPIMSPDELTPDPTFLSKIIDPSLYKTDHLSILNIDAKRLDFLVTKLESSVVVINPPFLFNDFRQRCVSKNIKQSSFFDHQHSPELWIPYLLKNHIYNSKFVIKAESKSIPLFHIVSTHPQVVAACATNPIDIWRFILPYWLNVQDELSHTKEWSTYNGYDFILTASHPASPVPAFVPNAELSSLAHATFLSVDADLSAKHPKDIIIPYFANEFPEGEGDRDEITERKYLLFFSSSPPIPRLRSHILHRLKSSHKDVIAYSTLIENRDTYVQYIKQSIFCLVVRGDTTSSSRLFDTIALGCIPVIVSDWILLPFNRIIDYSAFTVAIPEGIIMSDSTKVVDYLRSIAPAKISHMQIALREAKSLLLYTSLHVYNPVTLLLVDAVLSRLDTCDSIMSKHNISSTGYCSKLIARFSDYRTI